MSARIAASLEFRKTALHQANLNGRLEDEKEPGDIVHTYYGFHDQY